MKPTRLLSLKATNVMTFKKLDVKLENQGLVLITGPNGSAKSTIFEAMRHILLGKTSIGTKDNEIVRAGSVGGYLGVLDIERDGSKFQVYQSVEHKKYGTSTQLYKDNELVSHKKQKLKTQKAVAETVLKMTPQQYDSWVYINQEAGYPLVNGTGKECAAYLSESFGLSVFDDLVEKLKAETKSAEHQAGEASAFLSVLKQLREKLAAAPAREQTEADIANLKAVTATLQADNKDHNATLQALIAAKNEHEAYERALARAKEHVDDEGLSVDLDELRAEAGALRVAADKYNRKIAIADTIEEQAVQRKQKQAALEKAEARLAKMPDDNAALVALASAKSTKISLQTDLEMFIKQAAPLDRLVGLDGSMTCPTCGHEVDQEHLLDEIRQAKTAQRHADETRAKIRDLESETLRNEKIVADYDAALAAREAAQRALDALPPAQPPVDVSSLKAKRKELLDEAKRIEALVHALDGLRTLPKGKAVTADEMKAQEQLVTKSLVGLQKTSIDLALAESHLKQIDLTVKQIAETEEKLAELETFKRQNDLRKLLIKGLRKLKVRMIHDIVAAIQQALPPYLDLLFDGEDITIEVDDNDPESIERYATRPHPIDPEKRVSIPVRAMSKGERAKLRVAFIWALRQMMQPERTINMIVLDEADGGLDDVGAKAYSQLLDQLKSEFESVFVISHRKDLTAQWDQKWRLTKKRGISTLNTGE